MPLPQFPARVKVTTKDGAVLWLGDPPEAPWGTEHRWRLVEDRAAAGIWPWPRAVELERSVTRRLGSPRTPTSTSYPALAQDAADRMGAALWQ